MLMRVRQATCIATGVKESPVGVFTAHREHTRMLTIGEFSKLSSVPITALRYYDEMGLLKPSAVDPQTKYRCYSVDQLPRLNRILALKDLGFTLEQIAQVLDEGISREELQ